MYFRKAKNRYSVFENKITMKNFELKSLTKTENGPLQIIGKGSVLDLELETIKQLGFIVIRQNLEVLLLLLQMGTNYRL